ncbi:MAG: S41 family peptidase, partial [Acidobacteriota bacterium]
LARRGSSSATDALGRAAIHGRTVVTGELPGGLGYIRLGNFTDPGVVAEVRAALEKMRRMEGIVLDLRGNTGGLGRSADAIGDLLVGPGKDAGVDVGPSGEMPQVTGGEGALTDSPLVVLVDGQTGSAAERLARTLENTGRATLSGQTTFGKGRAQVSRVLPGGTTVLVSASEMLGPDRRPIQGKGLQPSPGVPDPAPVPPRP